MSSNITSIAKINPGAQDLDLIVKVLTKDQHSIKIKD